MALQDITGQKFGNLVAISFVGRIKNKSIWLWQCDCGKTKEAWSSHVKDGRIVSCGCQRVITRRSRSDWHGMTGTPEYMTWVNMHTRCYNPKSKDWPRYGGRGIKVCDEWHDFKRFYASMGNRPVGTTIDRIDNAKGYSAENCRWADEKTQAHNKDNVVWIEHNGETLVLSEWARRYNVTHAAIVRRMKVHGTLNGYKPYKSKAKERTNN